MRSRTSSESRQRAGFTLFEAIIVLVIVATVVGALTPSVSRILSRARVNRAAVVVAADLMMAQSLAGRQRRAVAVTVDSVQRSVTVSTADLATALARRQLGADSEFKLATCTSNPPSFIVYPNGTANTAVTLAVGAAGYQRQVKMSRAGLIRVVH
jgi:type II secretory pathway pseudopilin PulG